MLQTLGGTLTFRQLVSFALSPPWTPTLQEPAWSLLQLHPPAAKSEGFLRFPKSAHVPCHSPSTDFNL